MQTSTLEREHLTPDSGKDRRAVLEQMERILASPPFRHSKRYPVLLRYVVERTLQGQGESLKERTVGVDAFQRNPDYDTNIDPVVRVTAGEVRKRIAQYYHEDGHDDELRIDLPPGSYVPSFTLRNEGSSREIAPLPSLTVSVAPALTPEVDSAISETLHPASPHRIQRSTAVAVSALIGALLCVGLYWLLRPASALESTWKPLLDAPSVLVSIGEPSLASTAPPLPFSQPVTVAEHHRVDYLVFSDVQALSRLTGFLDRGGHPYRLQVASATTFADLRQGPAIIMGGFDNPWTQRALEKTRFQFVRRSGQASRIEDRRDPSNQRWSVDFGQPYASLTDDYAIVARFIDAETRKPVMIVAGVGENGTKAAAEFITDPESLRTLGPTERGDKVNFEVVLGTQVINGVSGPPRILAQEVW